MTESEIQAQIVEYLKACGCMVFRMNSGKARNNVRLCPEGTPDLLVLTSFGKIIWIEVKTLTGKLRDSQHEMIAALKARGQTVIIARDLYDVEGIA